MAFWPKGVSDIDLKDYGFMDTMLPKDVKGTPARVIAVYKERYEIVCEYGQIFAKLKSSVYYGATYESFPTAGDFVLIQYNDSGDSQIIKTLDRISYFSRREAGTVIREQAIAANFDYVFIMASLNNDFNLRRIERYLTLAWQSGGVPVIILTKADLISDYSEQINAVEEIAIGVSIHAISAKSGFGLELLDVYLKPGKTLVFLGSSGVGKSSLVNALSGRDRMAVSEIREDDSRGRHTTTHRQLIMLSSGVMIIDTPGMRELGMWDITASLSHSFSDVEEFLGQCKYTDCTHQSEPGCAIKEAISKGYLSLERWNSYNKLEREGKFSEDKIAYLRERQQFHKSISKAFRQQKKSGNYKKY